MKIKLLIIFSFVCLVLNIAVAQDEDMQYAKLQNINYGRFEGKTLKEILENDTLKGYVSTKLFADMFHQEFPYICLQYTKTRLPNDAVLLKVYLEMNPKEIKQIFKERSRLKLKKYANSKINKIVLYYPEEGKMMTAFSAEIGSRAADTTLWNSMDTMFIRKSIGQPLSFLLQNKSFNIYKAYIAGSRGINLHYGQYLWFRINFNQNETKKPYLYKDALSLWNIEHLLDEKIESIEVDISGKKHQILYFK